MLALSLFGSAGTPPAEHGEGGSTFVIQTAPAFFLFINYSHFVTKISLRSRKGQPSGIFVSTTYGANSCYKRLDLRDDLLKSTPLGWACRYGRKELVELLISRGAAVNEPDAEPWAQPKAWAEKMKHADVLAVLG